MIRVSGPRVPTRREQVLVLLAAALVVLMALVVTSPPAGDSTSDVTPATVAPAVIYQPEEAP